MSELNAASGPGASTRDATNPLAEKLTDGHLPVAAFAHLEATAIGCVDVDRGMTVTPPDGRKLGGQRDGLILVRLHSEPLKVLYVDRDPSTLSATELAARAWSGTRRELCAHVAEHCCTDALVGPQSLLELSVNGKQSCPSHECEGADPSVAVIISTFGREAQLTRCVQSVLAQRHENMEIIVVDNDPESGKALAAVGRFIAFGDRVRYVQEPRRGLSVARNRGVAETNAEIVAFTDDDVVADPDWLERLVAPFADATVRVSCGMVLPLELETPSQKRFEEYAGFCKGMARYVYGPESGPRPGLLLYPFINGLIGVGNNMAFRRAELLATGAFDAALGAGSPTGSCEETRAFATTILRGGRIAYEPRALCWHEHRRDGASLYGQVYGYGSGLGAVLARALLTQPRFYISAAQSLRIALKMRRSRDVEMAERHAGTAKPGELLRARRRGVINGPWLYAISMLRARRLGLYQAQPTNDARLHLDR